MTCALLAPPIAVVVISESSRGLRRCSTPLSPLIQLMIYTTKQWFRFRSTKVHKNGGCTTLAASVLCCTNKKTTQTVIRFHTFAEHPRCGKLVHDMPPPPPPSFRELLQPMSSCSRCPAPAALLLRCTSVMPRLDTIRIDAQLCWHLK